MKTFRFAFSATLALCALPVAASVISIGSGPARACYLAAESGRVAELAVCDEALHGQALDTHDRVATHVNRGILRVRAGNVTGGIADFDRALNLDPGQPGAYLNKGVALLNREQPREALPLFTAALERATRRPELAHYGRAVAHETLGRVPEAFADYQQASVLAPHWQEPRTELRRFRVVR